MPALSFVLGVISCGGATSSSSTPRDAALDDAGDDAIGDDAGQPDSSPPADSGACAAWTPSCGPDKCVRNDYSSSAGLPGGVTVVNGDVYSSDTLSFSIYLHDFPIAKTAGMPQGMTNDGSRLYWATATGNIQTSDLSGANVTTLVSGQASPLGIAAYAGSLYWANLQDPENKSIVRCEIANCAATMRKLPIDPQYGKSAHVAVDAKGVYWANYDTVLRADHDGANTTVIAASLNGVVGLAATGCVLYIAQAGGDYLLGCEEARCSSTLHRLIQPYTPAMPWALALTDTTLYIGDHDGTIWYLPRP